MAKNAVLRKEQYRLFVGGETVAARSSARWQMAFISLLMRHKTATTTT